MMTKFQTRSFNIVGDIENRRRNTEEFVESIKPCIVTAGEESIYNVDESGINLELHSGHCLLLERKRSRPLFSLYPL